MEKFQTPQNKNPAIIQLFNPIDQDVLASQSTVCLLWKDLETTS